MIKIKIIICIVNQNDNISSIKRDRDATKILNCGRLYFSHSSNKSR